MSRYSSTYEWSVSFEFHDWSATADFARTEIDSTESKIHQNCDRFANSHDRSSLASGKMHGTSIFESNLFPVGLVKMKSRPLSPTEITDLERYRRWLSDFIDQFGSEFRMARQPNDLPTLQSLLEVPPFSSGDEGALIAVGVALGDIIAETLGLEWVVVDDEYGSDFAISHPKKMVLAFPLTMILKRVERGEEIDVSELFQGVLDAIRQQIAEDDIAESD